MKKNLIGYVCFGEVNTPIERLQMKHDEALAALQAKVEGVVDGGLVIDDPAYETADAAYAKLAGLDLSCLIVCVAGWIPSHAVVKVLDKFRDKPMVLWGLCGWIESDGRLVTTAKATLYGLDVTNDINVGVTIIGQAVNFSITFDEGVKRAYVSYTDIHGQARQITVEDAARTYTITDA